MERVPLKILLRFDFFGFFSTNEIWPNLVEFGFFLNVIRWQTFDKMLMVKLRRNCLSEMRGGGPQWYTDQFGNLFLHLHGLLDLPWKTLYRINFVVLHSFNFWNYCIFAFRRISSSLRQKCWRYFLNHSRFF